MRCWKIEDTLAGAAGVAVLSTTVITDDQLNYQKIKELLISENISTDTQIGEVLVKEGSIAEIEAVTLAKQKSDRVILCITNPDLLTTVIKNFGDIQIVNLSDVPEANWKESLTSL